MVKFQISDYIGKRHGHLLVIGETKNSNCHSFDFRCDCGRIVSFPPYRVFTTGQQTCGKCGIASRRENGYKFIDYIGKRNNMLTVIGISQKRPGDKRCYLDCLCDCGKTTRVLPYQFKNGSVKSCGCLLKRSPNRMDGRTTHELYGTWFQMISRCENPENPKYYSYGKRGISVCEEWHDFWNFVSWSDSVGKRQKGFTLDRIDVNGNYEPSNCRWANSKTQSLNKRTNRIITYKGVSKTLHEWALSLSISDQSLSKRIDNGWELGKALTLPPQKCNQHINGKN